MPIREKSIDPVYVFEWPAGKPKPEDAIDGVALLIEGDDDFEYSDDIKKLVAEAIKAGPPVD